MHFCSVRISQLFLLVCETEAWERSLFWLVSREEVFDSSDDER